MEKKHTNGPWHAVNYGGFIIIQNSKYYGGKDLLNQEKNRNAEADGNLAAAAPALLKAAELALLELQLIPCKCDPKVIKTLEKAINKALIITP